MVITVTVPLKPGMVFAEDAFDGIAGAQTTLSVSINHRFRQIPATIIGAEVVHGGQAAILTLEMELERFL